MESKTERSNTVNKSAYLPRVCNFYRKYREREIGGDLERERGVRERRERRNKKM